MASAENVGNQLQALQAIPLSAPKPMCLDGDLNVNWKKFKRNFQFYHKATEMNKKSSGTQAAILLHCIREEVLEIFDTLELTQEEKENYDTVMNKLETYFIPKGNQSVESHKFNIRKQGSNEKFDNFLMDLRKLANSCDFGELRDRLIRDRIVSGVYDQKVKDRLLRDPNLTLRGSSHRALNVCVRSHQLS